MVPRLDHCSVIHWEVRLASPMVKHLVQLLDHYLAELLVHRLDLSLDRLTENHCGLPMASHLVPNLAHCWDWPLDLSTG